MKALFKKSSSQGILPCCEDSMSLFDKIPDGALVMVEYIKSRNYENHKRFFALVKVTFDNQDTFDNYEIWRKHLLMVAGHYEAVVVPIPKRLGKVIGYLKRHLGGDMADGIIDIIEQSFGVQYWPCSITFDKMDENEFNEMFNNAINGFIGRYGNGITEDELLKIIAFD